jgi:ACT domain
MATQRQREANIDAMEQRGTGCGRRTQSRGAIERHEARIITARLAEVGISVNTVSAFYHDHLFVPDHRVEEALSLLQDMSTPAPGSTQPADHDDGGD